MAEAEVVPNSVAVLMGVTSVLSLASLFYLFQKHIDGRPLLAYQPRERVPWGVGVAFVAIAMPVLGVIITLLNLTDPSPAVEQATSSPQVQASWGDFVFMIGFVVVVGAWIAALFYADQRDFGLPTSWGQAARDVGIGCFATIASMVPIYAVQLLLITALRIDTKHPLVEQVEANQSTPILVLAFAMAVIAAPLFEEFTFRCLLQGWLEKHEDQLLGFTATERDEPAHETSEDSVDDEVLLEVVSTDRSVAEPQAVLEDANGVTTRPSRGWIPELPHGWTPILISGVLFGLAHVGHGVAPISLVLFGVVLGYLYQRTHRLLPCIAAHMLFNAYSMLLLWLQLKPGD